MDVVRTSAVGAIAACSMFALLSTTRLGYAEHSTVTKQLAAPISDRAPAQHAPVPPDVGALPFSLSGPVLTPPPSPAPTIYGASLYPRPRFSGAPVSQWEEMIEDAARRFNLPPSWVRGVMQMESGGQTMLNGRPITSSAGAIGLMQVMPETFAAMTQRYGLGSDPYEPRANILAGAAFLREMYDRYGPDHFLAAYNAGPGRVDDHLRSGRALPFETQRYVQVLAPQLLGDANRNASIPSPPVQDLTSVEALRRAAAPAFRSPPTMPVSPEAAPLFVASNVRSTAEARQPETQPDNSLFVRLAHQDQRRVERRDDGAEN